MIKRINETMYHITNPTGEVIGFAASLELARAKEQAARPGLYRRGDIVITPHGMGTVVEFEDTSTLQLRYTDKQTPDCRVAVMLDDPTAWFGYPSLPYYQLKEICHG